MGSGFVIVGKGTMIGAYCLAFLGLFASQTHGLSARELGMRAIKDEGAKNSILMYDPKTVGHTYNDISELVAKVKSICECEVEHLPSVQSLILHYKDSAHLPASAFSFIPGIVYADEDESDDGKDRFISESDRSAPNDPEFGNQWALASLTNNADINWQEGHAKYLADS